MDVKIEGHNVDRHFDQMLHNEQSNPANTCPWLYQDGTAESSSGGDCKKVIAAINNNCTDKTFAATGRSDSDCCKAKKCVCSKYGSNPQCCSNKTKHHIIPDHCFKSPGETGRYYHGFSDLSYGKGLAVCAEGEGKAADDKAAVDLLEHEEIHRKFDRIEDGFGERNEGSWSFGTASRKAAEVCGKALGCDPDCLAQQIRNFYREEHNASPETRLRAASNDATVDPPRSTMGNPR
jgi:hypothetical protein